MPTAIDVRQVRRLLEQGAQIVEVLPEDEYLEEHLPGAINVPLRTMTSETVAQLDRHRPVVVYCYDGL